MEGRRFYVYAYIRLDSNTYFYIGKGTNIRCKRTENYTRSTHFINILNKTECALEILYDNLTEQEALDYEMQVIDELLCEEGYTIEFDKDIDKNHQFNHLVNCTLGGEGISGYKYTEEQRKRCARPGEQNGMYGRKGELCPSYGIVRDDDFKNRVRKNNPRSIKCYCIELDRAFDSCSQVRDILREEYGIKLSQQWLSKNIDNENMTFGTYIESGEYANLHFIRI